MKSHVIHCLSEAVSPISHMSGKAGNEAILAREPVLTTRGIMTVPFLSGNALRHRCVREPGALWLIDRLGLKGRMLLPQLNFLVHGGNCTQSTATENTKRIADGHRLWPLLRLCGGSLPDQILAGSLDVWRGVLVCEENRQVLSRTLPFELPVEPLLSAEKFASGYQYTRGDAAKLGMVDENGTGETSQMIYSGQAVSRGAVFHHGFVLKHASDLELGCLLLSLRLWQECYGGTIGGSARLGHGRLKTDLFGVADSDDLVAAYVEHVEASRAELVAWLMDAFTPKSELRSREKRAKQDG